MKFVMGLSVLVLVVACATGSAPVLDDYEEVKPTTTFATPPAPVSSEVVRRGRYMVELAGCGVCHTDGALIGEPDMTRWLAGSRVGIAHTDPLRYSSPGVLFPPNLTPDEETGLGRWSAEQIAATIRSGDAGHRRAAAPVMPYSAYAKLSEDDVRAIVAYLRSLPPVRHAPPAHVSPGQRSNERYVYFGVYRSRQ